jgi:transcriptional regulator of acetoin/glycerol metabolism
MAAMDLERTRRVREALVTGGVLAFPPTRSGVPPVIERSWRRCVSQQVSPEPAAIPYSDPESADPLLRAAAEPVLARLGDQLADVPVAMVLADAGGRIVMRRIGVRSQRAVMDRASAAEGFDFSEAAVGTNGLGTVLAERRPVLVRGTEHYNVGLADLTCAGTPILEPFTGRLVGTFSLACATTDVHPLMCAMAGDVGRQIEANLLDGLGAHERALVRAYLAVERPDPTPVLVVGEQTAFANQAGLCHLGPQTHALLWSHLAENAGTGSTRMRVPLPDGWHEADVERVGTVHRDAFRVQLLPSDEPSRPPRRAGSSARPPVHLVPEIDRQVVEAVRHGERIVFDGAAGVGKLHTARAALRRAGAAGPLVLDAAVGFATPDSGDWFAAASAALEDGRGVVLRHLEDLERTAVNQVKALAEAAGPLAFTVDLDGAPRHIVALAGRLGTTIRLPALSPSRDRIPALVESMLADLPDPQRRTRFAAPTWRHLLAWSWPGNVGELRCTVEQLARRAQGNVVEPGELPDRLRRAARQLTLMAAAEREAVLDALRDAGGNRSKAAQTLGIGRTTLYRKLREFGID